ncbi:MAG TPA: polyprenyl synthetase family protein [Kofleriaceae bacterium]|nr:polyprenyl synthetase family protein [Kofleriaceae bacterium]
MSTRAIDPAAAPAAVARLLDEARAAVDAEMDRRLALPGGGGPAARLVEAMRYAALAPGKRIRPALVVAACEAAGGARAAALAAAAAVEMLHSYTLVHDDLPAMDDDDERRGRPTVHRAFDEATAILAGDGLLTAAFAAAAEVGREAVAALAARSSEVLAGQALDLAAAAGAAPATLAELERIHRAKTGALFAASAELGAISAGAPPERRRALADYGMAIGTAFQYADDVDDGDFPSLSGEAARRRIELGKEAIRLAETLPSPGVLIELARWISGL